MGTIRTSLGLLITVPATAPTGWEGHLLRLIATIRSCLMAALLLAIAGCGAATTTQSTTQPTVRIVSPVSGAKIHGQTVTVRVSVAHITLTPGAGPEGTKVWIYANGQLEAGEVGEGATSVSLMLSPGTYTLKAILTTNGKTVASSRPTVVSVSPFTAAPLSITITPAGPLNLPGSALAATPELGAVAMLSATVAVAGGSRVILRTTNDGVSWTPVAYLPGRVFSFDAVSGTDVLAATDQGALYRSTDRGRSWQAVNNTMPVLAVTFLSGARGFALETGGSLVETTDGGATWQAVKAVPSTGSFSFCFTSATQGFALGRAAAPGSVESEQGANLYVTTDAGTTWRAVSTLPAASTWDPFQVGCTSSAVWLEGTPSSTAVAPFTWLRSTTAGKTWQTVTVSGQHLTDGPTTLEPVMMSGGSRLHLLGFTGGVVSGTSSASGLTVAFSKTPLPLLTAQGIPDPCGCGSLASPLGISFANGVDGMIVSTPQPGLSVVLTTHDGGQSWQVASRFVSPHPSEYVSFVTPTLGFGLSSGLDQNAVLKTTDGGQTWTKVGDLPSAPGTGGNASLAFVSAEKGFAVADNSLVETQDGGRTWGTVAALANAGTIWGVAFASPSVGCVDALAGNGGPWVTTDGGATWTAETAGGFYASFGYSPVACAAALANPALAKGLPSPAVGAVSEPPMVAAPGDQTAILYAQSVAQVTTPVLLTARVGSSNWSVQVLPTGQFDVCGCSFSFVSASQGFVTSLYGRLYETTDGGRTWLLLP